MSLTYLRRGVVPSIASTIIYNLPYGGPVSMVWGWALSAVLIMFIGLAMVGEKHTVHRDAMLMGRVNWRVPCLLQVACTSGRTACPHPSTATSLHGSSAVSLDSDSGTTSGESERPDDFQTTHSWATFPPCPRSPGHVPASSSPRPPCKIPSSR